MIHLRIEKGVPIPASAVRQGSNIQLLKDMQPGDSVFFEPEIVKKATRFYRVAKKLGYKIIIRKEGKGMRMWRAEDDPLEREAALKRAVDRRIATQKPRGPKPAVEPPKPKKKAAKKAAKKPVKKLSSKEMKRERDKRYRQNKKAQMQLPDLGVNIN